jgi:hypothetical protein
LRFRHESGRVACACYASLAKLASASDLASDRACLKGRALDLALHSRTENWFPVLVLPVRNWGE